MRTWFAHHVHAHRTAWLRLIHQPTVSMFTLLSLGIILSLPALMAITLLSVQQLAGKLPDQNTITVYAKAHLNEADLAQLSQQIAQLPQLAHHQFISKQAALTQLSQQLELGDLSKELADNPLPDTWVLTPEQLNPNVTQNWIQQLSALPSVALVQGSQMWSTRLHELLKLGRVIVIALSTLLACGVVTFFTILIRLQILSRLPEIEISRLIGATDAHISRPFLYFGILEGALAGLLAALIVFGFAEVVSTPIATLAQLFASSFHLWLPTPLLWLAGIASASTLGLLGAWLAVRITLWQTQH